MGVPEVQSEVEQRGLPQRFGEFLLFDKIGQGGMAEIFLGKALGPLGQQRLSVIKRVLPLLSADPQFADMLVKEAKLCASLSHKNVVQVTDLGRVDEQLYIAMEYVEGFDLNDLLRRCTKAKVPLPAEFIFFIMEEVLRALDYAHRATDPDGQPLGIIHRDVSPTNVLISCEGEVKLCDFGIARAAASEGALPDGVLKGKFAYMSPEQARGENIDQRADIFAAGILLWELIAGHRLYRGGADEVLSQAQQGKAPPLPDRSLPQESMLQELVACALSPDPEQRFQTAREMLAALGEYVQGAGLFASQLRFAGFLRSNFGEELQRQRRARERASTAVPAKLVDDEDHGGEAASPLPEAAVAEPPPAGTAEPSTAVAEAPPPGVPVEPSLGVAVEPPPSATGNTPLAAAEEAPVAPAVEGETSGRDGASEWSWSGPPGVTKVSAEDTARLRVIGRDRPWYRKSSTVVALTLLAVAILAIAVYFYTQ